MKTFLEPLMELEEFHRMNQDLEQEKTPIQVTGCVDSQKVQVMWGIGEKNKVKYQVVIACDMLKAKEIYEDYKLYDQNVCFYPAKDLIFYHADIHGNAMLKERIRVFRRLWEGKATTVITTFDAGIDHLLPLQKWGERAICLKEGMEISLEKLKQMFVEMGYERCEQVEAQGQFVVRGGLVDVFPLTEEFPYRIEFWDDEIDTIRAFDMMSQKSMERLEQVIIYPAVEVVLSEREKKVGLQRMEQEKQFYVKQLKEDGKIEEATQIQERIEEFGEHLNLFGGSTGMDGYISYFCNETVSFFDYFNKQESCFFIDEPNRVWERAKVVEDEFMESMVHRMQKGYILPKQVEAFFSMEDILYRLQKRKLVLFSTLTYMTEKMKVREQYDFSVRKVDTYRNHFSLLIKELQEWRKKGYRVVLLCSARTRAKRLVQNLETYGLHAFYSETFDQEIQNGQIMISVGGIHSGFAYPSIRFAVLSESDLFGLKKKKQKKPKKASAQMQIQSFQDLVVGDYVVHENHGLGIYKGIEKIVVDGIEKDYVKIEYAAGGVLYILATGLECLQKYSSANAEGRKPKLNKLGSPEWKNTKKRVKGAVKEIAKDLVELYAKRQQKKGYAFTKDTVWQKEFEETFPYEETRDQLLAIEATKQDMESEKIMDRLICGDVGYGKTEIALRAAFKAVIDEKQVAFLVPTTILAQQHYHTFIQRMKDFPVQVAMLSRFRSKVEQQKTIEDIKKGTVDIVIGTHRILSQDIKWKDLGLLIIDEEQRFGVTHKEKIKRMKETVDVLTLSATPIPRTLHMSLVGIRDMSVLEEPPVDRMPIQTYVLEYNEEIVREAICREMTRGGQVYYVYNRVDQIQEVANKIARLVPQATVAFAHGQMKERELERIMFDFIHGEIDVLVSTTIVETGLDIPNVNTILIQNADCFGLSQLYQLRGRVGRTNRIAYAFLMYQKNRVLKEVAEKRLHAMKEFTDLGSGFKIAMRDLEIRGAGNLLGAKQHGHMEAVGYDLYCKMLKEAVGVLKGEQEEETYDTTVDLSMDAFIPETYVASEAIKLNLYKRIAEIQDEAECTEIEEELVDRFGDLPKSVQYLLQIAFIKAMAHRIFLVQVLQKGGKIKLVFHEKAPIKVEKIPQLLKQHHGVLRFFPDQNPYLLYQISHSKQSLSHIDPQIILQQTKTLLRDMEILR